MRNPYAPPEANIDGPPAIAQALPAKLASGPLYSPNQIAVAAFLGSPVAAAWFARSNYRALEQPMQGQKILVWGVVATIVVMGIAFILPDQTPNSLLPILYSMAIRVYAESQFRLAVGEHLNAGGAQGSWWRVAGISLLFTLAVVAVLVAGAMVLLSSGLLPE